jgi:hypothetical protein
VQAHPIMAGSPDDAPAAPDIDENEVDRAQIRAMLRLTPEQRLRRVEEFVESALELRELNATRATAPSASWLSCRRARLKTRCGRQLSA